MWQNGAVYAYWFLHFLQRALTQILLDISNLKIIFKIPAIALTGCNIYTINLRHQQTNGRIHYFQYRIFLYSCWNNLLYNYSRCGKLLQQNNCNHFNKSGALQNFCQLHFLILQQMAFVITGTNNPVFGGGIRKTIISPLVTILFNHIRWAGALAQKFNLIT